MMLEEFGRWYLRQMRDLLPARLVDARQGDALLVTDERAADPPGVGFALRRRRRQTPLGRFGLDAAGLDAAGAALRYRPRQVLLRLGPGALLEREVTLPLAAETDPAGVLRYDMDRLTPFSADDVVWSYAVTRRDRARAQLLARLWLVPAATVRPLTEALARLGTPATVLEAAAPGGIWRRLPLTGAPGARPRRMLAIAAAAVAGCAVAAIVTPFFVQWLARDAVEQHIAALAPRVTEVETLRHRLAAGLSGADVLATERARLGDALQVLATVTDILPDDTVLSELSLRQGKLGISGQSPAAARLIPALAADPLLRNPTFVAPVTRASNEQGEAGMDQFVIRADLAP